MLDKDTKKYLFFLYCYPKNVKPQNRIDFIGEVSPFSLDFVVKQENLIMSKAYFYADEYSTVWL